ncbi:MAG: transposase, partial [Rhodoplanes sp.]
WGQGEQAVLDYLARYVFRIAITNARIVGLDDAGVTVAYRNRKTGRQCTCRLGGDEFPSRWGCCHPHTGSLEAVARLQFPQNVACGFPALRSSAGDSQHCKSLQLRVRETQLWFQ